MKILKIMSFAVLLSAVICIVSCGNKNQQKQDTTTENAQPSGAMEVDALLADADELTGKEIAVEGVCTHICKHGGAKIFLMGSDDTQTIRIEAGQVGKFTQDCVNSIVKVNGTLVEQRIDEDYLAKWEERVKAETAEKHGDSAAGCSTEKKARGEADANSAEERIANFRKRIAERKEKEGKEYLSFYYVEATDYKVL